MKGGDILAAGTQGCIVSPKLIRNGNTAMRSTNRNNSKKISKIFSEEYAYQNEYEILNRVYEITNGLGVIVLDNDNNEPVFSARKLNPLNYANLNTKQIRESGCQKVKVVLNQGQPIYVINQPKIIGDIRMFARNPKPLHFYDNAYGALLLLKKYHIRHRDMSACNIFYDRTGALIGDFGYAVDLDDPTINLKHYNKTIFQTKEDIIHFFEEIRPYVQLTNEQVDTLIQKIKENDFLYFYELAGIDQDQIPMRVLNYINEHPTEDIYIPTHYTNVGGSRRRKPRKIRKTRRIRK